jgi:predicted small metal-binding protein
MASQSDPITRRILEYVRGYNGPAQEEDVMPQKQVTCDCGKIIREPSDEQLVAAVQKHAKEVHDMDLSREQVLSMAEPA